MLSALLHKRSWTFAAQIPSHANTAFRPAPKRDASCFSDTPTIRRSASERTVTNFNAFKDFYLKAKAEIWSLLSCTCRVHSRAAPAPKRDASCFFDTPSQSMFRGVSLCMQKNKIGSR